MDYATNETVLKIGTILNGQYIIERVIGKGGFGITYLCRDNFLKIRVAIKEYFPSQIVSRNCMVSGNSVEIIDSEYESMYREGLNAYEYEANKLTKFSDLEGVVSVLNFFFENGTAYMVMEYVEGITLKKYLSNHSETVSWKEMLSLMGPVFESLKPIHDAGIIHRDISPDNIMISKEGKLVIIDFGSAKNYSDRADSIIALKHGYAPPEQYSYNGNQGPWTDVYALCATMYRMISGKKLPKSVDIQNGKAQVPYLRMYDRTIPKYVENAIFNGLNVEIAKRTPSVKALEGQLKGGILGASNLIRVFGVVAVLAFVCYSGTAIGRNLSKGAGTNPVPPAKIEAGSDENKENPKNDGTTTDDSGSEKKPEVKVAVIPDEFQNLPDINRSEITYETDNSGCIVIKGIDSTISKGKIPTTIDGKPVKIIAGTDKGIGANIVDIMLPEGVEKIEENAFRNCVYLESIYIPSTVSVINKKAFNNCQSLRNVTLSENNSNFYINGAKLFDINGEEVIEWQ